jgi:histidyl-tRNA synthetase
MLFKILKRGDKLNLSLANKEQDLVDLGLRYDLTVPLCRFYANNRTKLPQHFKVIQVGSVWRAERPQKGTFQAIHSMRYRYHWNCWCYCRNSIDFSNSSSITAFKLYKLYG